MNRRPKESRPLPPAMSSPASFAQTPVSGVLVQDLYLSKQGLLFLLFFFVVYFVFRSWRFVALLSAGQLAVSLCTYSILIDDHRHRLALWQPTGSFERTLYRRELVADDGGGDGRSPGLNAYEDEVQRQSREAVRILTGSDGDGANCSLYRAGPDQGNRHVFATDQDLARDDGGGSGASSSSQGMGSSLSLVHGGGAGGGSVEHTHYVFCTTATATPHQPDGAPGNGTRRVQKISGINVRLRDFAPPPAVENATTGHGQKKRAQDDDETGSGAPRAPPPPPPPSSFAISVYVLAAAHFAYSVLGTATAAFVCRVHRVPPLFRNFSLRRAYRFYPQFAELVFLFCSFLAVDEYIPETRFPVGIWRTYLLFVGGSLLIYVANRTDRNVDQSGRDARVRRPAPPPPPPPPEGASRHPYSYDTGHGHLFFCTTFLVSVHFFHWCHAYLLTVAAAGALVLVYGAAALATRGCCWSSARRARIARATQRLWRRTLDRCTRFEQQFVG